ncbi:MAG: hypothetical protein HOL85_22300 [Rhodospirillaceae bacterium]|jgi:hypothetical protein|nr:hypothetical protein [Rhodospirillaceae bacterium]MBT6137910.1 hypothetical protein [Rhodospirillaceae bacterium]
MRAIGKLLTIALFGLMAIGTGVTQAHTGHQHASEDDAAAKVTGAKPRAAGSGESFEIVAVMGRTGLVVFVDYISDNRPAVGAEIELIANDAELTLIETAPGLYLAEGWTPEPGGYDLIFTVIADDVADLVAARLEVPVAGAAVVATKSKPRGDVSAQQVVAEAGPPIAIPILSGVIALIGVSAGLRNRGTGRKISLSVAAMAAVTALFTIT